MLSGIYSSRQGNEGVFVLQLELFGAMDRYNQNVSSSRIGNSPWGRSRLPRAMQEVMETYLGTTACMGLLLHKDVAHQAGGCCPHPYL